MPQHTCVEPAQPLFTLGVDEFLLTPFAAAGGSCSEMIEVLARDMVRPALQGAV